jgi:hypothetical protein
MQYKLPLNLPSRKLTCVAVSDTVQINENLGPVPDYVEKLTINMLASNINSKLGADLYCDPYAARPEKTNTKVCLDVLTIGGHHAEAVSRALADRGATVQHLSMPHYRVSAVHCGKIEEALKTLKVSKDTVIMLQVFDSGFYMVRTEAGSLIPPCRRGGYIPHRWCTGALKQKEPIRHVQAADPRVYGLQGQHHGLPRPSALPRGGRLL